MTRTNPGSTPVVEAPALIEGIRSALLLYVSESDLSKAVGETGKIHVTLEVDLNRGRVQRTKGACWFERYVELGGH